MFYIEKGTTNEIGLTLTETSELINPIYLFELIRNIDSSKETFYFTAPDISTAKNRLNVFELVEGEDGLELPSGEYTYNVYESENPEPETVADTTGRVVETGRMNVGMSFEEDEQNNVNTDPYGNI